MFDRDGRWLYSAGRDGLIRRWKPIPDPDPDQFDGDATLYPRTAALAPDGRSFFAYSTSKRGDERWELIHRDVASFRALAEVHATWQRRLFSAMASASHSRTPDERRIRFWDVFANRELASLESPGLADWAQGLFAGRPGSRYERAGADQTLRFRDGQATQVARRLRMPARLSFSADGRFFAVSATPAGEAVPSVTLWKMPALTEVAKLPGPASELTFSPDGQTLAVIHSDIVGCGTLIPRSCVHRSRPRSLALATFFRARPPNGFSPDGKLFAHC